jgi:hypothetical protein
LLSKFLTGAGRFCAKLINCIVGRRSALEKGIFAGLRLAIKEDMQLSFATLKVQIFILLFAAAAVARAETSSKSGEAGKGSNSAQQVLAQKARGTCEGFQEALREFDNKALENIGNIDNLNLNDRISVEQSRSKFADSVDGRRPLVLRVDTCERLHSQILNYYSSQDIASFFQQRLSTLIIGDLGIGRLKAPDSVTVIKFFFDLKIALKSSTLEGVAVWEFVAERMKEFAFEDSDDSQDSIVEHVLDSSYSDNVKGQPAENVSLEQAGDYVDAKFGDRTSPIGTSKIFRSDSHDQLELRP